MVDTVFCLISLGIAAITTSAVFLYVGFLFLVSPSEDMLATKMRSHEATQSAPAIASHKVTPPPDSNSHEVTRTALVPIPAHDVTAPADSAPHEATRTALASAIPAHEVAPPPDSDSHETAVVYSQRANEKEKGVSYEQYRARMQYLQKQQAEIELRLTDPNPSTAERSTLERQKAYWGRAIQQMLSP